MEESNNKELIEVIRERLKAADDIPYRAGAWEGYKAKYEPKKTVRLLPAYWAAAAALVVAGFTFLLLNKDEVNNLVVVQQEAPTTQKDERREERDLQTESKKDRPGLAGTDVEHSSMPAAPFNTADATNLSQANARPIAIILALHAAGLQPATQHWSLERSDVNFELNLPAQVLRFKDNDDQREIYASSLREEFALAQRADAYESTRNKASLELNPKRFNFNKKFELGAFLSPSTTNQSFDVGGGLVLAYQLSDKLALRTGAAFNQYEVGLLGSELSAASSEGMRFNSPEATQGDASLVSKDVPYRASNMLLPDLNSVSGKVQTLDIPLEIKYNVGRQFYATGGVSYAVVLSQERFNHITEYSGAPTYSSASDSGQPTNQPTAVERTLQTEANNVNTNGFGGFVNFSIGRKTTLSKSFKLSIEPYVKIPIGQFKSADMDYTNGGLRVITTF